jgi:hypothetical protein
MGQYAFFDLLFILIFLKNSHLTIFSLDHCLQISPHFGHVVSKASGTSLDFHHRWYCHGFGHQVEPIQACGFDSVFRVCSLYVTDSSAGAVWRIARGRRDAEIWVQDALLAPDTAFGANGDNRTSPLPLPAPWCPSVGDAEGSD